MARSKVNLVSTSASGWGTCGIASNQTIPGDGCVEFTIVSSDSQLMIGLSESDPNTSYDSIKFAAFVTSGGTVLVFYELGAETLAQGAVSCSVGNNVRVRRVGSAVYLDLDTGSGYSQVHTATGSSSNPLLVDVAISTNGNTIGNVKVSDNGSPVALTWQNNSNINVATSTWKGHLGLLGVG